MNDIPAKSCVIIGAGLAGVAAAGALQQDGWQVLLLDKGRGVGGRMATRRAGESRFDHGAQFFTVREARFQAHVDRWHKAGWVTPWFSDDGFSDDGHVRYRGAEGMNALARELARELPVKLSTTAARVTAAPATKDATGWRVSTTNGDVYDAAAVIMTPPVPQSLVLLGDTVPLLSAEVAAALHALEYHPCFALMATLDGPSAVPSPGYVRPGSGPVAWIADNFQKGISARPALTIHATPEYTRAFFDAPQEEVASALLEAAQPWLGGAVTEWQIHRWKFTQPVTVCPSACLVSAKPAWIAFAGDAFGGPRVEGAFLSGLAAADALIASNRSTPDKT